jgi:hypothetical protein
MNIGGSTGTPRLLSRVPSREESKTEETGLESSTRRGSASEAFGGAGAGAERSSPSLTADGLAVMRSVVTTLAQQKDKLIEDYHHKFNRLEGWATLVDGIQSCRDGAQLSGYEFQLQRMDYYQRQGTLRDCEVNIGNGRRADMLVTESEDTGHTDFIWTNPRGELVEGPVTIDRDIFIEVKNYFGSSWDSNLDQNQIRQYVSLADNASMIFRLESKYGIPHSGNFGAEEGQPTTFKLMEELKSNPYVELFENIGTDHGTGDRVR